MRPKRLKTASRRLNRNDDRTHRTNTMSLTALEAKLTSLANQLSQFINADATTLVQTDNGAVKSLAGIQEELFRTRGLVPCVNYNLLSELPNTAAINTVARVIDDSDNNGMYIRKASGWNRYGWEDIQYFTPSLNNQSESKSYLTPNDLTIGKIVIQQEMIPSTVKNRMYAFDIRLSAWQNQTTITTPSAEITEYRLVVINRGLGEYQYTLSRINTTSVNSPINLNIQVALTNNGSTNQIVAKAIATGQLDQTYAVAEVTSAVFDGEQ